MPLPFEITEGERMWALGSIGAVIAWFAGLFGERRRRERQRDEREERLHASLSQMVTAFEVLLIAIEISADKRQPYIDRAKSLAEDAKAVLNVGRSPLVDGSI